MSPAKPALTITVAIPTLGRFEEVRDTLEGILAGTRVPDEILVSDQNTPALPELDSYLASHAPRVRHLRTEPKGVVYNMNRLLAEAKSDVILYVDDDVVPSPKLVEAHLANYADTKIAGVAGRVEQPSGDLPPEEVDQVGTFRPWTGGMTFRFNGLKRQHCVFAQGANMSFRRTSLLSINGFDEGFGGNGYFFESDATLRLVEKFPSGLVFDPLATLKHLAAPRGGARVHDRAIHNAFFVQNAVRLYRRHCPKVVFPFLILKLLLLTVAKSFYRLSPRMAIVGVFALRKGFRADHE
jgi:GT2 family glycosyltransferase